MRNTDQQVHCHDHHNSRSAQHPNTPDAG
jgi:hypothetical protein